MLLDYRLVLHRRKYTKNYSAAVGICSTAFNSETGALMYVYALPLSGLEQFSRCFRDPSIHTIGTTFLNEVREHGIATRENTSQQSGTCQTKYTASLVAFVFEST